MSDVQFEEQGNEYQVSNSFVSQKVTGISNILIKIGVAKNESQARIVMVIITLLCFAVTFFVVFSGGKERDTEFEKKFKPGTSALQP